MVELANLAFLAMGLAAAGFVAYRIRLPAPLGYLLAGVAAATFWPELVPHGTEHLAELGILVLLFLIGLDLDLKRLRDALKSTSTAIPFDIAVPALLAAVLARGLGWDPLQAASLGLVVGVSSTLFGERLAAQPGVDGRARQRVIGVLIAEDVVAGALIATLVVMGSGASGIGTPAFEIARTLFVMLLLTAAAVLLIPRLLDEVARRHQPELVVLWAVGMILVFGYIGGLAGSAELGALVAGVAAAEAGSRYVTRNSLIGLRDLSSAVFFFAVGAGVQILVVWEHLWGAVGLAAVVLVGNVLVHVPASVASGLPFRASLQTGASLATLGEFNLILVAVATREGLAHPAMLPMVVGAMVVLLPVTSLFLASSKRIDAAFWRLPARVRRPFELVTFAVRRRPTPKAAGLWKAPFRRLLVNLILIGALGAISTAARGYVPAIPGGPSWSAAALWLGITAAVGMPLLYATYTAYKGLVWALVGLQPGERVGAGKVRARLVDAWVAVSAVLLLGFIALWVPRATPVLAGGAIIAAAIAAVAWRRLNSFHRTVGAALGRVLGDDEAGVRFLDQVMEKYPWGVRFAAVSVPSGSPLVGLTLRDTRLGALTGATVAVIQRGRQETVNPSPDTELLPGDHLVLLGDSNQLARAEALIVAHRDAVRLSAQSHAAQLMEITVKAPSKWVDQVLGDLRIREETGTLVVGRWKEGAEHPQPFRPELIIHAGDRLILLGTPLQLQRARVLAEGIPEAR